MENVSDANLDTNAKLLEWLEKKFQRKVNEKMSADIALTQFVLETKVEDLKKVLEKIFSLYTKLCNPKLFTQESKSFILSLESQISSWGAQLPMTRLEWKALQNTATNTKSVSYIVIRWVQHKGQIN